MSRAGLNSAAASSVQRWERRPGRDMRAPRRSRTLQQPYRGRPLEQPAQLARWFYPFGSGAHCNNYYYSSALGRMRPGGAGRKGRQGGARAGLGVWLLVVVEGLKQNGWQGRIQTEQFAIARFGAELSRARFLNPGRWSGYGNLSHCSFS